MFISKKEYEELKSKLYFAKKELHEMYYEKALIELEKGNYEVAEYLFYLFDQHELYKYIKFVYRGTIQVKE